MLNDKILQTIIEAVKIIFKEEIAFFNESYKSFLNFNTKDKLQESLRSSTLSKEKKGEIYFLNFITKNNLEFLDAASKISEEYFFIKWFIDLQIERDFEKGQKSLDKIIEIYGSLEKFFNFERINKFFEVLDWKNIHIKKSDLHLFSYFLDIKKINDLYQALNSKKVSSKIKGWEVNKEVILEKNTFEIGEFDDKKLCAYLPEKFRNKKFINAIKKGFAKTRSGSEGIKLLEKSLFELKTWKNDERLYTSNIYKNSDEKLLILFDKQTNHSGILRLVHSSHLEITDASIDDYILKLGEIKNNLDTDN